MYLGRDDNVPLSLQAKSLEDSLRLLDAREKGRMRKTWATTPIQDRPTLLAAWIAGPGAIYPADGPGMGLWAEGAPSVGVEAAIHAQIRATNPARGDRIHKSAQEALFSIPRKAACAFCGLEDLEQLSSVQSICAHSICSVCYTVTHEANSAHGPPKCPVRCGGSGVVRHEARHEPCSIVSFAPLRPYDEVIL